MTQPSSGLVRVALRIGPQQSENTIFEIDAITANDNVGQIITISDKDEEKKSNRAIRKFMFDTILPSTARQDVTYEKCVGPLVDNVLQGFNAGVFAYGQGNSGKTHTIFGRDCEMVGDQSGLIPRSLEQIFNVIEQRKFFTRFELFVSFYEIYDDVIGDLGALYLLEQQMQPTDFKDYMNSLQKNHKKKSKNASIPVEYPMRTLDTPTNEEGKIYANNLSDIPVNSKSQVLKVIESGLRGRSFIESASKYSNRCHTVVTLTVAQKPRSSTAFAIDDVNTITGRIHFIDLASSEFRFVSKSVEETFTAIGSVMESLQQGEARSFSESLLTSLLEPDIEHNFYTSVIGTLSPDQNNYLESLATLQFAHRCKNPNSPPVAAVIDINTIEDKDKRIKELESNILRLHKQINDQKIQHDKDIEQLKNEVLRVNKEAQKSTNRPFKMEEQQFILLQSSIPNSKISLQEINERDRKIERMSKEKQNLLQKIDKNNELTTRIQTSLAEEEKIHKAAIGTYRKKVQELTKQITQLSLDHKHALRDKDELHRQAELEMRTQYEKEIQDLTSLMNTRQTKEETATQDSYAEYDKQLALRTQKEKKKAEMINTIQDVERSYMQKHEMFDELLKERDKKMELLRAEYDQYRLDMDKEIKVYDKEVSLLYEYSTKLSHVLQKMEIGAYPVQVRFNTKMIRLTEKDRPEPVRVDLLPHLQKKIKYTNEFIRECETMPTKSMSNFTLSRSVSASGTRSIQKPSMLQQMDLENKYNDELTNSKPSARRSRPSSVGSSVTRLGSMRSITNYDEGGLPSIEQGEKTVRLKSLEKEHKELKIAFDVLKREKEDSRNSSRASSSSSHKRPSSAIM